MNKLTKRETKWKPKSIQNDKLNQNAGLERPRVAKCAEELVVGDFGAVCVVMGVRNLTQDPPHPHIHAG